MVICMSLKKINKLIRNQIKKNPAKKTETSDVKKFSDLITKEETGINRELFKRFFNFQRPSAMLKAVYNTDNKEKNRNLINVINRVDSVI